MRVLFQRKYLLILTLALAVICVACALIVGFVKYKTNRFAYKQVVQVPNCYTAIVFGAGIRNGKPSKYLKDRLDAGIRLYKTEKVQRLLLSGDNGSRSYDELKVMRDYCFKNGVDTAAIFLDFAGFDTYSTLYRAKEVFKVDRAVLVSQNYHLDRAIYIGRSLGLETFGYAADTGHYAGHRKNKLREMLAIVNAVLEVHTARTPKFLGETVDIQGSSNAMLHY